MAKVAVIGAGAAGMAAAVRAAENHDVAILEGNDKCGKKLLLTGNGKCNYWNDGISSDKYSTDDADGLSRILGRKGDALMFLEKAGLYPKIKNGYYYPCSNQAASVAEIFKRRINGKKIRLETGFKVQRAIRTKNGFRIISADGKAMECEKLIIAAGSRAYPKTGSDGSGYALAKSLGHTVNEPLPALTALTSRGRFLKEWEKIRCDARVSLFVDGELKKQEEGELQLTSSGISGICTFNVSGTAARALSLGKSVRAEVNFMPWLENVYGWFCERCAFMNSPTLEEALESVFNYKLMFVLLKEAGVDRNAKWETLSEKQKRALCRTIERFGLEITGTDSFERAQVCTGGVPLGEIDCSVMKSKLTENLYFAGEILDADGICGGYNLAFAFISGYLAGGLR